MVNNLYNQDIEYSLLGCFFFQEATHRLHDVQERDFYFEDCRKVYAAMAKCIAEHKRIDLVLVGTYLDDNMRIALIDAVSSVSTSANIEHYMIELKSLSLARRLKNKASGFVSTGERLTVEDFKKVVDDESKQSYVSDIISESDIALDGFVESLKEPDERIKFGLRTVDRVTGGLSIPSLTTIGAEPSVGKTSFFLNLAMNQEKSVVVFSLEMTSKMILERIMSMDLKVDYQTFRSSDFKQSDYDAFLGKIKKLKELNFHIFDNIYNVEAIVNVVAKLRPKLVLIDYLQIVRTLQKQESKRLEIAYIIGTLREMMKTYECACVVLSQVSRQASGNAPTMFNLYESAAIEQGSDCIIMMDRPYIRHKDEPEKYPPEHTVILIDKNKFGQTGTVNLRFEGKYQRFYELEKEQPQRLSQISTQINIRDDQLPF